MEECEGIITAMSVLVSRFKHLPRGTYNDNASNLAKSIILRFTWIDEGKILLSDRFHYRGQNRNTVTEPESYQLFKDYRNSEAESINQTWNLSRKHIRYLSPKNVMPYLAIRSVLFKKKRSVRKKHRTQNIDDSLFEFYIKEKWICNCSLRVKDQLG